MNNLYLNKYHRIPDKGIGKLININLINGENDFYFPELHNIEWFSMYDETLIPILKSFKRFEDHHLIELAKYLNLLIDIGEDSLKIDSYTTDADLYREINWKNATDDSFSLRVFWNFKIEFLKNSETIELDILYKGVQFFLDNNFGYMENDVDIFGNKCYNFDGQNIDEPEIYLDMLGLSTEIRLFKFKDFKDKVVPFGILVDKILKKNMGLILDEVSLNLLKKSLNFTNLIEIIYE